MIFGTSQPLSGAPESASDLVTRAQQGDPEALAALFRTYSRRLAAFCAQILHNHAAGEDAASEVFLRLESRIALFDASAPFERWLFRIAANHCIDQLRRRQLEDSWLSEPTAFAPLPAASPLSLLLTRERQAATARAVQSLPDAYRLPLVLRYFGDLNYEEIAAELALEKSQVAGRIFRAKQMLRISLKEYSL